MRANDAWLILYYGSPWLQCEYADQGRWSKFFAKWPLAFQKFQIFTNQNDHKSVASWTDYLDYYTLNSLTLLWLAEIRNQRPWRHKCNHTVTMSRTLKVTGNDVKFARFVLLPVSEEAKTWLPFFLSQCIIKRLLDSVFVISRVIKVSARGISRSRNPYLDLDYFGHHKNLIQ